MRSIRGLGGVVEFEMTLVGKYWYGGRSVVQVPEGVEIELDRYGLRSVVQVLEGVEEIGPERSSVEQ